MSAIRFRFCASVPLLAAVAAFAWQPARAAEMVLVELALKDHAFTPATATVPAGQRFRIQVTNHDDTPEEFESHDLRVEKIVTAGGVVTVNAGPLKPGTYPFVGEFHPDTAKGTITVSEQP